MNHNIYNLFIISTEKKSNFSVNVIKRYKNSATLNAQWSESLTKSGER